MRVQWISAFSIFTFLSLISFIFSDCRNGTYWAAARLLEEVKYEKERAKKNAKKTGPKRVSDTLEEEQEGNKRAKTSDGKPAAGTKSKAQLETEAQKLIQSILAVEGVPSNLVYDSCPTIVTKIKEFIARPGVTKKAFCLALGNLNSNSLNRFLAGKGQDQCGNITYRRAYVFFEKLRILEGQSKSANRLRNEEEKPSGFSFETARAQWYLVGH